MDSNTIAFWSAVFAAASAGAAIIGLILSQKALIKSGEATAVSKDIARRQGVIELHNSWKGVNAVNCANVIGPDATNAANALSLTSALWNHDVIDKNILFQSYWNAFRDLYDSLYSCNSLVPGTSKICRDLITSEITRTYLEMKALEISNVTQTQIGRI